MISLSSATRIFIVTGVTDMRKSFNGLYGIVAHQLKEDPLSGHVFVFCNRVGNRIKLLIWDGSGLWVCAKRLEKGRFHWNWDTDENTTTITHESLSLLLGGLDLAQIKPRSWYRKNKLPEPDPAGPEIPIGR
jgi:transposase